MQAAGVQENRWTFMKEEGRTDGQGIGERTRLTGSGGQGEAINSVYFTVGQALQHQI
jgi:hypothetical protein